MNKQDEEIMKAAAKAAGGEYSYGNCADGSMTGYFHFGCEIVYWNPLDDDGDAFRLAIQLAVGFVPDYEVGEVATTYMVGRMGYNIAEEFLSDPLKATRRAIVRAAAHIGGYR